MKYYIWKQEFLDEYVMLDGVVRQIKLEHRLTTGELFIERWSPDAYCQYSKDFPQGLVLNDNLIGSLYVIVSNSLKSFLQSNVTNQLELLPLALVNHKGEKETESYFLVNPLEIYDCIDQQASELDWDRKANVIDFADDLIFDERLIPDNVHMFRAKYMTELVFISQELKDLLEKEGFIGLRFVEAEHYSSL
ncbi:MAG: hypothetical protein KUG78_07830 [Kangiellaceae bacterium]|nr:hypothetical protein [Kangiellaceae bacterium]